MTETIQTLKEDIAILQEKLQKLEEQDPEMLLLRQGKVDVVDYDGKKYFRIEYTDSFADAYSWYVRKVGEDAIRPVRDVNVYAPLEELYKKEVVKQKDDYPYKKYTPEKTEKLQEKNWYVDAKTLLKPKEPEKEQQIKELVRESVKWCEEHPDESVEDYLTPQGPQGPVGPGPGPKGVIVGYEPTPQTPEQVADGLKEAFRESVKQGVVSSTTKAQNLYDIICDCMVKYNSTVYPGLICDILDAVDEWLPKEQSANSQNVDVEFLVEGFNDCLNKIRRKLR